MSTEELETLGYNDSDSSVDSSSSDESTEPIRKRKVLEDEYESDDEDTSNDTRLDNELPKNTGDFAPTIGVNTLSKHDSVTVLLRGKERILISGLFSVRIIKGGIVYNGSHYNASKETFNFWHPLSHAIPEIKSSFYAGFEEERTIQHFDSNLSANEYNNYDTVLQITNSYSRKLLNAEQLFSNIKNLWVPRDSFLKKSTNNDYSFDIITPENNAEISILRYTKQWTDCIQKLDFNQKNASYDVRVLILGGKNSGKSTFIRTLTEKILYSSLNTKFNEDKEMIYLDLDPGQPEYSFPDCISMNRLSSRYRNFGQHFGQVKFETIKQLYIGSSSPQDFPSHYLDSVQSLIASFDDEMFAGTSCVNLPGWVKGFGLNILQKVLEFYKPTDIVYLESRATLQHFPEIKIPASFTSSMNVNYSPRIHRIPAGFAGTNNDNILKYRFVASDFRIYRLLCLLHRKLGATTSWDYDFNPLIKYSPYKLSFGHNGIRGIKLSHEFSSLNGENILKAIEGTIIGMYHVPDDLSLDSISDFKLANLDSIRMSSLDFKTLGLVHSVNIPERYINIYIPIDSLNELKATNRSIIIARMNTETPFCELYPAPKILKLESTSPFVTFDRRKKYEHVWKVRRNVKRKGHHI
ncbi:Polynucleotide 5'-hydroxyl-kinase GRC3 [Nakaseomyces bracarensis]|uniref:Polynucleotide 5'-hydroxyl-kinase GRC3 n=1 Tax=Nakaseomyces bracarensis TaxID=273131 RepID=A0ABR4NTH2_9SACH